MVYQGRGAHESEDVLAVAVEKILDEPYDVAKQHGAVPGQYADDHRQDQNVDSLLIERGPKYSIEQPALFGVRHSSSRAVHRPLSLFFVVLSCKGSRIYGGWRKKPDQGHT